MPVAPGSNYSYFLASGCESSGGFITISNVQTDASTVLEVYLFRGSTQVGSYVFAAGVAGASKKFPGLSNGTYTVEFTPVVEGVPGASASETEEISCTTQYPSDGTFLRNGCNGYNLQQVLADGSGGERWGNVVEYNSTSCGYVPPTDPEPEPEPEPVVLGCTDPTADNYNPEATLGNADQNVCTYSPKVFTEVKVVEVLPCSDGVCLRWFNSLGGIDTWLFDGKVDRPFASEASGEFSYSNGLLGAASKSGQPSMVLRAAGLNYNRYKALWQLYTSPKVWIHTEAGEAEEVYVQPATLPAMPLGRRSYDITVEITKVPINTLRR